MLPSPLPVKSKVCLPLWKHSNLTIIHKFQQKSEFSRDQEFFRVPVKCGIGLLLLCDGRVRSRANLKGAVDNGGIFPSTEISKVISSKGVQNSKKKGAGLV